MKVTNPANGCTATARITVLQNTATPNASASVSGVLTCTTTSVTLSGASTTPGVSFSWTGPVGFTAATTPTVLTSTPGNYVLKVINPVNGCTTTASVTVLQNTATPDASASVSGVLTCTTTSVNLSGASTTPGATFSCTRPGGSTTNAQTVATSIPGDYFVTVTSPVNGCTANTRVTVLQNNTPPLSSLSFTQSNDSKGSITVTPTPGATYCWTVNSTTWEIKKGQGTNSITIKAGTSNSNATYTAVVTNPATGCTSTSLMTLIRNGDSISEDITPQIAHNGRSSTQLSHANTNEQSDEMTVSAYPTIFSDHATVEFTPVHNGYARVEIINLGGAKVSTIYNGNVEAGKTYQAIFSAENHSGGVYIFKITTGNKEVKAGKIILTR